MQQWAIIMQAERRGLESLQVHDRRAKTAKRIVDALAGSNTRSRKESKFKLVHAFMASRTDASSRSVERRLRQQSAGTRWISSDPHEALLMGEQPIYADFILVAVLHWLKQVRPDAFDKVLGVAPEVKQFWEACEQWR